MIFRLVQTTVIAFATALAFANAGAAQSVVSGANWPSRPIHLIVPFGPGSSSDVIARIVGQKLAARLGQAIVIENKAGGSTVLGTEIVARANPDGYTLELANTTTHATIAAVGVLSFDPVKDFAPVGVLAYSPFVLLVTPGLEVHSVKDLVALAKAKPGALNYASAGIGTMAHLAGALFTIMAGVEINHVPYRGTEQSMIDLMQGRIELLFGTIAPSLPLVRTGKLRALATSGPTRNGMLPDLPTLAEAGLNGYEAGLWTGLVFPAGAPPLIIQRLNTEANAVMREPDVVALLAKQGVDVETGTPEAFAARIKDDLAKWRQVVTKAHIKPLAN